MKHLFFQIRLIWNLKNKSINLSTYYVLFSINRLFITSLSHITLCELYLKILLNLTLPFVYKSLEITVNKITIEIKIIINKISKILYK